MSQVKHRTADPAIALLGDELREDLDRGIEPREIAAWIVKHIDDEYAGDLALDLLEAALIALRDGDCEPLARTVGDWDATAQAESDGTADRLLQIEHEIASGEEELIEWRPRRPGG